jgi:DNA (cytosine-5)-methyltransferase 1
MRRPPTLLDLFCGAGGAAVGYARAGFHILGIDHLRQRDYPLPMEVLDAMDVLARPDLLDTFDVVHASPPCLRWSVVTPNRETYPDLIAPVRDALLAWGGPYVIENVVGAPLRDPVLMCGAAFGLGATCRDGVRRTLRRHRHFESNLPLTSPGCGCVPGQDTIGVYGGGGGATPGKSGYKAHYEEGCWAMGITWMRDRRATANAIPPAYTEHLGHQIARQVSTGKSVAR